MATETPTPAPHIERLRALLSRDSVDSINLESENNLAVTKTYTLNEREEINTEYFRGNGREKREVLQCMFERNGALILHVIFGAQGLEYIGIGGDELRASFAGSKEIHVGRHLDIGPRDGVSKIEVLDEEENDFQQWSEPIIGWIERVVKNGEIGELPFKVASLSEEGEIGKIKERAKERIKDTYLKAFNQGSEKMRDPLLYEANGIMDMAVNLGLITLRENEEILNEAIREHRVDVTSRDGTASNG